MISDLCDFKSILNPDALFVDGCDDSTGGNIIIKRWTITDPVTDKPLLGSFTTPGQLCWKFASWTKWAPYLVQFGHDFLSPKDAEFSSTTGRVEDLY